MSRIEQLIQELCPGGVVNAKLTSIANVLYGCPFDSSLFTEDDTYIPLIRIRDVLSGIPSTYYKGEYQDQYIIKKGDILVGMDGNFNLGRWNSKDGVLCQRTCKISSKSESIVLNNYLYHLLGPLFKIIEENTPGGSVKHLSAKIINGIEIPLPPLPIQEEIVRILDTFTEAQANLEQELELRKKQYEYYRNQLLTFDENDPSVKLMTLGDLGKVCMCKRIMKNQTSDKGEIPFFKIGTFGKIPDAYITKELFEDYKAKYNYPEIGDILISAAGTIGRTVVFDGTPSYFQDSNIVWIRNNGDIVSNNYLKYYYTVAKWEIDNGGVVSRLYNDSLRATKIPVPSKERQQQIVSILDKFESAIQTLEEELALRKKQYEYYREKLLTFN